MCVEIGLHILTHDAIPPKRSEPNDTGTARGAYDLWQRHRPAPLKLKEYPMSRRCEFTGKGPMSGNNVSHAKNRTRRRFLPNLNDVTLQSEVLGRAIKFKISAAALRTVDHRGGLDGFMAKAKDDELSDAALKVKKEIAKAQAASA